MPDRPVDTREVPEGYELVAVPDPDWRLVTGKRCRQQGAGHRVCAQDAVAELNRNAWRSGVRRENWYAYCGEHLYGRWIEDGQVMHWILREKNQ